MSTYILSIDQGTTSSRAILFNEQGENKGVGQQDFQQIFPQPGWVEHDAKEIWDSQWTAIERALASANASGNDIAAIGITNQRETTVVWDRQTGEPIHNAIVWQDRRTAKFCDSLRDAGHVETFKKKTGLVIDAYFSGTKLKWILDHVEGAREKAENGELCFGTIDSWLIWKLTHGAVHVTDPSNASRTLLFNIHTLEWDEQLLQLLDIPKAILPEVKGSSEVVGKTHEGLFSTKIPIAGIAGDQQAALFGQQCTQKGMVKNTYGTGCFLLMNTGEIPVYSENNLLTTIAWKIGDTVHYALEGSVFVGGAAVQWIRDGLQLIKDAKEIEALATSVEDNGGVYFVPALAGLGAPYWDSYARGAIVGLTRGSTHAHIARATLEGIAYQVYDIVKAMEADANTEGSELRVDGGATANNFLLQFQSDIFGFPVVRPKQLESTALGAAYLAGLAVGYWENQESLQEQWAKDRTFEPALDSDAVAQLIAQWHKAVGRSKNWIE
ncbi:glycerol kinase GlpK [Aureisphaera galaxeae]|uniref:glycerol kinase GlpK n=1 Tax=Aureisphaera galaxeae TaxID=1538023 RepID=UPI0023509D8C|nr:glycerol kinase GlpK [Aureisphaera galaxeae]MDC8002688.1 glycerol kinase GlpK [Aureisphaera galaxeae]